MFKYLIFFVLLSPLIGISLVEGGAYATSVGRLGVPNGATVAYGFYVATVLAVALLIGGMQPLPRLRPTLQPSLPVKLQFMVFSRRLLLVNGVFLIVMLFVFNGIQVLMGGLEKGAFRTSLGSFGAVPYMMTKFILPVLFAYSTSLLMAISNDAQAKRLWWINALLILMIGSTWGFKTTGVFMLLPGLLILNWDMNFKKAFCLAVAFLSSLVVFFFFFDADLMDGVNAFDFLLGRLTVLQGDVSWYIWGHYSDGEALPNYFPTLLAGFGDTIVGIFYDKNSFSEWMSVHYDWMLTYIAVDSEEAIINGHSVTGTPFSEGVIAGGWVGVAFIAIIAGLLIRWSYRLLDVSIISGKMERAALISTYFCFNIFAWLNGGGITQLFHVSVFVNIFLACIFVRIMKL